MDETVPIALTRSAFFFSPKQAVRRLDSHADFLPQQSSTTTHTVEFESAIDWHNSTPRLRPRFPMTTTTITNNCPTIRRADRNDYQKA